MSDLPPRLQQVIYEEITESFRSSVDRLEAIAHALPPVADDFRAEVGATTRDLRAHVSHLVELVSVAETRVGKKIDADVAAATRKAIADFQLSAQRYIGGSMGPAVAAELRPFLREALDEGKQSLAAARTEIAAAQKALSLRSARNVGLALAIASWAFFVGLSIPRAAPTVATSTTSAHSAASAEPTLLQEIWTSLFSPPNERRKP